MQSLKNITTTVVKCACLLFRPCENINCLKGMYILYKFRLINSGQKYYYLFYFS